MLITANIILSVDIDVKILHRYY